MEPNPNPGFAAIFTGVIVTITLLLVSYFPEVMIIPIACTCIGIAVGCLIYWLLLGVKD